MPNRSTFISVPHTIDDMTVLRRFLDKLVEQIDVAFSNRGEAGFASSSSLSATTTSLSEVIKYINSLDAIYLTKDSSNLDVALEYQVQVTYTPRTLADVHYVDTKYNPTTAPNKINSTSTNAEIKQIADTLDELITKLKDTKILV